MASGASAKIETHPYLIGTGESGDLLSSVNLEDVVCPVCLEFPHNAVLLQCSSYDSGCRPFMCDTDHSHSNCLGRFKSAYGVLLALKSFSAEVNTVNNNIQSTLSDENSHPSCPLCRGIVTGWVVIDEARKLLNTKERCCDEKSCTFIGNYEDLHDHAMLNHPDARPSEIDPSRKLEWDNFQQSSDIIDVLSTIHTEVPHGVVLGDYVIEYGDDDTGDEFEDFPGDEGNWWTSCILYHVFDNFRNSRNRRRSRALEATIGQQIWRSDDSNAVERFPTTYTAEHPSDGTDDETDGSIRGGSSYHSSRRRRLMSISRRPR